MIKAAGNTELCELKHSAKHAYRTGTPASSTARAGTSCEMIRKRTRSTSKFTLDLFSIPNYHIQKGRPHGHRYGKKEGDHEYFIANQFKKKCKKREFLSIHDRLIRDARFFFSDMNGANHTVTQTRVTDPQQKKRSSQMTSCTEGVRPSDPLGTTSNSD